MTMQRWLLLGAVVLAACPPAMAVGATATSARSVGLMTVRPDRSRRAFRPDRRFARCANVNVVEERLFGDFAPERSGEFIADRVVC